MAACEVAQNKRCYYALQVQGRVAVAKTGIAVKKRVTELQS